MVGTTRAFSPPPKGKFFGLLVDFPICRFLMILDVFGRFSTNVGHLGPNFGGFRWRGADGNSQGAWKCRIRRNIGVDVPAADFFRTSTPFFRSNTGVTRSPASSAGIVASKTVEVRSEIDEKRTNNIDKP